jgi:hypothetical protein
VNEPTVTTSAFFSLPNNYPKMTLLARTFHGLAQAPLEPFDAGVLDRWAKGLCHGHLCAVSFVLSVWSGSTGASDIKKKAAERLWVWKSPRFDLHEALGVWDDDHRAAFLAWTRNPWWP